MGKINDAIMAAKESGDIVPLMQQVKSLPNGEPTTDFDQDGVPPTNEEGEGFDTITAAWMAGDLSDTQYQALIQTARAHAEFKSEMAGATEAQAPTL